MTCHGLCYLPIHSCMHFCKSLWIGSIC
uniref:Uncharacterized protein n=1 Tax=Anguilla anguilla TaxID=7936 RepID=A0A0E9SWE8_ANGAN